MTSVLSGQPGFFSRDQDWWERVLDDPAEDRPGRARCAACWQPDDDGVRGYALYRTTARWEEGTVLPDGAISVWELIAADPAAGRGPLAGPAQPRPDHLDHGRPAVGRRPAALPAARLAPRPGAPGRQPLGADHRPACRAHPSRLLRTGGRGARGHRRAAACQRGPLAAAGGRPGGAGQAASTARGRASRPTSRWTSGSSARPTSAAPGWPRWRRPAWSSELRPGAVGRFPPR